MSEAPKKSRLPLLLGFAVVLGGVAYWDYASRREEAPVVATARPRPAETPPATAARPAAEPPPRAAATGAPAAGESPNPLAKLRLEQLSETLARPLFDRTRRPPPKAAPPPPPPPPAAKAEPPPPPGYDPSGFRLLGVLAGEGRSIAVITRSGTPQPMRLEEGDVVEGWRVETVDSQKVVMKRGSQSHVLEVFRKPR